VATITLDRPEARNALNTATKEALLAALTEVHADDAVRAVVVTGAGRAFCVGQDLREHADTLAAGGDVQDTVRAHYNPIALAIATMPKPVVAAVNGPAAGAGAGFAFAADLRLASERASFVTAFAGIGLSADSGMSWTLQRLVGYARASALLLLSEPVTAAQALDMGLVNAVVEPDTLGAAAHDLAARMAAGPTIAYAAIKTALARAAVSDLPTALETEAVLQQRAGATQDHRNATAAFLAKQTPVFTGH